MEEGNNKEKITKNGDLVWFSIDEWDEGGILIAILIFSLYPFIYGINSITNGNVLRGFLFIMLGILLIVIILYIASIFIQLFL